MTGRRNRWVSPVKAQELSSRERGCVWMAQLSNGHEDESCLAAWWWAAGWRAAPSSSMVIQEKKWKHHAGQHWPFSYSRRSQPSFTDSTVCLLIILSSAKYSLLILLSLLFLLRNRRGYLPAYIENMQQFFFFLNESLEFSKQWRYVWSNWLKIRMCTPEEEDA